MKSNDFETTWNERKQSSGKQKRLNDFSPNASIEESSKISKRMALVCNDREMYDLIFGAPGEYPAFE